MSTTENASLAVMQSFSLDHNSTVPLYSQLAQQFEQAIADGSLPPGTLLLSEIELAEALDLSQPTARQAIQKLADKGLVVRRRGIGTRVAQPTMQRPPELTSLHDDLVQRGQEPSTEVLTCTVQLASRRIAELLAIDEGDEVLELVRLRRGDGEVIAVLKSFLPSRVVQFGAEDLATRGLYELLRSQGITLHAAHQTIGARAASATEAVLLEELPGAALLTVERVTYDDEGRVVEFGHHLYVGGRYTFEIDLLTS